MAKKFSKAKINYRKDERRELARQIRRTEKENLKKHLDNKKEMW